ncbi:MAG: response regulator [Alkaliphilus sp.]
MLRVLIVEDDPMVAYLNEKYIKAVKGFQVIGKVANGEEALKVLLKNKCDLVLLDVYMPKVNGIELLKKIRKNSLGVDVIFVTAAREHEVIDQALKLGSVDFLIKPFEFERFKKALTNYLIRHEILIKDGTIMQKEIDLLTRIQPKVSKELPKGLQELTLKRIRNVIIQNRQEYLSADEVADFAGISRVTARKYLEYLESIVLIECEIKYGTVGRPSYVYKLIE